MTTLRTSNVFPDRTSQVSGQYDAYNVQADGVDVIRAEHINSTFNSIQKAEAILLDGYALNNVKLHDGYAITTLTGFDLNLTPASGKDAYVTQGNFHVTSGNIIADGGSAVLKLQSKTFDPTGVQDGQTLVYNSTTTTFVAGASGDASFKLQTVATPNATLKSGYIILDDGRELNLATDTTINLTTVLGSSPANATSYYLYVDLSTLPAPSTVSGRKIFAIAQANFALLTSTPDSLQMSRYLPIAQILSATSGTAWSGTGSAFATLATRRHDKAAVNASPVVYSMAKQSVGAVGAASVTQGALGTADFPTPANAHAWSLNNSASDANGTPLNLSEVSGAGDSAVAMLYSQVGFFARETQPNFIGSNDFKSTSSTFNVGNTNYSFGGWFRFNQANQALIGNWNSNTGYLLLTGSNAIQLILNATTLNIPFTFDSSWHHIVATYASSGTTGIVYIDGQKAGSQVVTPSAPGTQFRIGAYQSSATGFLVGSAQDCFFTTDVLTDSQVLNIYSKRFSLASAGKQLASAHAIDGYSLPLASYSSKVAFFSLAADVNDGSVNSKNLTNNGTTPFTGLGLFGVASSAAVLNGTTQSLSSTDAFFNPGNGHSFGTGGWFAANNWAPASAQALISNWKSSSDRGFIIQLQVSGGIGIRTTNTSNTDDFTGSTGFGGTNTFAPGSWHHIFMFFDFPNQVDKLYIDGVLVLTIPATNMRSLTTSTYRIGADDTGPGEFFAGRVREVVYVKDVQLTDADIAKLVSARLDHNANVLPTDQRWSAVFESEAGSVDVQLDSSYIVDADRNSLYLDLSLLAPDGQVQLRLENTGITANTVPVTTYDSGVVAASAISLPITHGLGQAPTAVVLLHEVNSGEFESLEAGSYLTANATQILGSLSAFGSDNVRIVASSAVQALGLTLATPTAAGIVTSFASTVQSSVKNASADYTITTADGYSNIFMTTGSTDRTITLPSASANAGRTLTIKKVDSGIGFLKVTAADNIDGVGTYSFCASGQGNEELNTYITVVSDGTTWRKTVEKVKCSILIYGTTNNATSGNVLIFSSAQSDTHTAYSTGTGRFTVPVGQAGVFDCRIGVVAGAGPGVQYSVYKNGSLYRTIANSDGTPGNASGSVVVPTVDGDILDFRPSGTTGVLASTSWIEIFRIL